VAARYFGFLLQAAGTTIGDLYQARSIIEPAAAGLLATSRTKQDITALENCLQDLEEMVSGAGDDRGVEAWGQAAQRFHELVVDLAGNQTLALQTRVLHEVVATHLSVAVHLTFDRAASGRWCGTGKRRCARIGSSSTSSRRGTAEGRPSTGRCTWT